MNQLAASNSIAGFFFHPSKVSLDSYAHVKTFGILEPSMLPAFFQRLGTRNPWIPATSPAPGPKYPARASACCLGCGLVPWGPTNQNYLHDSRMLEDAPISSRCVFHDFHVGTIEMAENPFPCGDQLHGLLEWISNPWCDTASLPLHSKPPERVVLQRDNLMTRHEEILRYC